MTRVGHIRSEMKNGIDNIDRARLGRYVLALLEEVEKKKQEKQAVKDAEKVHDPSKAKSPEDAKPEIEYWGAEDAESVTHEDFDEAVESLLDDRLFDLGQSAWPAAVEICGFVRRKVSPETYSKWSVEALLENLDAEYMGESDQYPAEPTNAMLAAEAVFHAAVIGEYEVHTLISAETVKVNVMDWVRKHCPDWLNEGGS